MFRVSEKMVIPLEVTGSVYITDVTDGGEYFYVSIIAPDVVDEGDLKELVDKFPLIRDEYEITEGGKYGDILSFEDWLDDIIREDPLVAGTTGIEYYAKGYLRASDEVYKSPYFFKLSDDDFVYVLIVKKEKDYDGDLRLFVRKLAEDIKIDGLSKNRKWQEKPEENWYGMRSDLWLL